MSLVSLHEAPQPIEQFISNKTYPKRASSNSRYLLLEGDALATLRLFPAASVECDNQPPLLESARICPF